VPDDLRTEAALPQTPSPAGAAPAAPPVSGGEPGVDDGRPARHPSWLRALLVSLLVLAAGSALGAAGYHYERTYAVRAPEMARTDDGWRITGRSGRQFSGLGLSDSRLIWQEGPSIEYADLDDGRARPLGPGAGMSATWDPAIGERYAIWFEAERPQSLAASAIAYDTESGRRWPVADVGSVYSYPAISDDVAVWCSARALASPTVGGVRIGSGETFTIASGYGAPVISGGLVVWATSETGPFTASELSSGNAWPVAARLSRDPLTAIALSGRTLVWGQASEAAGSGVVAAAVVDGGDTRPLAAGITGLAGPAFDGTTVVWAEEDADAAGASPAASARYRVLGRRLGGGPAFVVAEVGGTVSEVAVSGRTVAWIASVDGVQVIETTELPR
jgi:hypothetical protein